MILTLVVLALVIILGLCLCPKKMKTTPMSKPKIEIYRREHASGIVVSGVVITFPTSYGKIIYSDGTEEDAELYDMRVRLKSGTTTLNTITVTTPQTLPSQFTSVDLDTSVWYMPSEKGKKVRMTIEGQDYTQGQDAIVEVGFRNQNVGDYVTVEKNFGIVEPPSREYTTIADTFFSTTSDPTYIESKGVISADQCKTECDSTPECATIYVSGSGGECQLFKTGPYAIPSATGSTVYTTQPLGGIIPSVGEYTTEPKKILSTSQSDYIANQDLPFASIDQCKQKCDELSGCKRFFRNAQGKCRFFREGTQTPTTNNNVTLYTKVEDPYEYVISGHGALYGAVTNQFGWLTPITGNPTEDECKATCDSTPECVGFVDEPQDQRCFMFSSAAISGGELGDTLDRRDTVYSKQFVPL